MKRAELHFNYEETLLVVKQIQQLSKQVKEQQQLLKDSGKQLQKEYWISPNASLYIKKMQERENAMEVIAEKMHLLSEVLQLLTENLKGTEEEIVQLMEKLQEGK